MRHSGVVTSYCYSLSALNPVERKESQCYSFGGASVTLA